MTYPLPEQFLPNCFIEYNGYRFNPKTKSMIRMDVNLDSSRRVDISKTYLIRVTGYITPRLNIPGDDLGFGIQLPEPTDTIASPGLDPYHELATNDSEISLIQCKLNEPGKTFRYIGQGAGDLYVNTIDPNTGLFVPDIDFGPFPKIVVLRPVGFRKAWYIEWQIKTTLKRCCSEPIDFNIPSKRIQEYNYRVSYSFDEKGYCRRNISGVIKIISPMYRGAANLNPIGDRTISTDNTYDTAYAAYKAKKESITDIYKTLSGYYRSLSVIFTTNKINVKDLPDVNILDDINATEKYFGKLGLQAGVVGTILDLYSAIRITLNNITVQEDALEPLLAELEKQYDNLLSTRKVNYNAANSPSKERVYLNTLRPLPKNLTFGPLPTDNIPNFQNYETVDQYRDLVYTSIQIPFNFARVNFTFNIADDKRTATFNVVDQERPAFSFIPGYSRVNVRHNTRSQTVGFNKWSSTLSARFTFSKFVYGTDIGSGYAFNLAQFNDTDVVDGEPVLGKVYPKKMTAYSDFLHIVFQRFAYSLVQNSSARAPTNYAIDTADGKRHIIEVGAFIPQSLTINEDVTGDNIEFSISYMITSNPKFIFQMTGHGLPCILSADLGAANFTALADVNAALDSPPDAILRAMSLQLSTYTDATVHERWVRSMQFAATNSRGSSNLILNRNYDAPIQICNNSGDLLAVLPFHGETTLKKGSTNLYTADIVKFQTLGTSARDSTGSVPGVGGGRPSGGISLFGRGINFLEGTGAGIFTGLFSKEDIDLYFEDNYAAFNLNTSEDITLTGIEEFAYTTLEDNINFVQDDTSSAFFDGTDNFITNKIIDFVSTPSPEKSWALYECELEVVTDNNTIRQKILPKQDVSPKTDPGEFWTLIQNNFDAMFPIGPDMLMGEEIKSEYFANNPPDEDSITYLGSPSNSILLRGRAIRVGYQVIPPTLLMYGGQRAYQRKRRFASKIIGRNHTTIYGGAWEIEYMLLNVPVGMLGTPDHPDFQIAGFGGDEDVLENILDEFTLADQQIIQA